MKICSVIHCEEPKKLKGLCAYHYGRKQYKGDFPLHPYKRIRVVKRCEAINCTNEVQAAGLCMKHYRAFHRWKQKNGPGEVAEYIVIESAKKKRSENGTFL